MSFGYRYLLVASFPAPVPADVVAWLEAAIAGAPIEPAFELTEAAAGMEEDAAWLVGEGGRLGEVASGPDGPDLELVVHPPDVYEDATAALYGLPMVLAPYCADGMIGAMWTDMEPDVDPTLFFVQDGVLFVGGRNDLPRAAVADDPPPWRLGTSDPTSPEQARRLLARSARRAVRDADLASLPGGEPDGGADEARLRAAVALGARLVLGLIDEGGDPTLVKDTPGWLLQEVAAADRYGTRQVRSTGVPLTELAAAFVEADDASLDHGPQPLGVGQVITTIAPLSLVARSSALSIAGPDRPEGDTPDLAVEVPVGTRLEVTEVYERGHANCRPVDGSWPAWVRGPAWPGGSATAAPVADPDRYALGWIQMEDEGRLWQREP